MGLHLKDTIEEWRGCYVESKVHPTLDQVYPQFKDNFLSRDDELIQCKQSAHYLSQ